MKILIFVNLCLLFFTHHALGKGEATVFSVATEETHGLERYMRSARVYGIDVELLGVGKKWTGGDMNYAGGAQKINLLKEKVNELYEKGDEDQIILFTDSYDVMFLGTLADIVRKFKSMQDTRVLFSAEPFCWPDSSLAPEYPKTDAGSPYLNSGGFIGYLKEIHAILNVKPVKDKEDDQLYYTKIFLNKELRKTLKISLDYNSAIFQNLNGALSDVELRSNTTTEWWPYIENVVTKEKPLILHGNGPSKSTLNSLGNYLAESWSALHGCKLCTEKQVKLEDNPLPTVLMAVYIEQATPFLEEFFSFLVNLDYPKGKIHLLMRNAVEYHEEDVEKFVAKISKEYASVKRIKPIDFLSEAEARNVAQERCLNSDCDYIFYVDSLARITAPTLKHLLASGFDVVAPVLARPGQAWSNFWGALNAAGFYARSADYMDIVNNNVRGIWNVPFITNCFLVKSSILKVPSAKAVSHIKEDMDPDMAYCATLRDAGIFMHVSNEIKFGHLVNPETFDVARKNPDMYQVFQNKLEWEHRYIHKQYEENFEPGRKHLMPCPDVYWFPLVTMRFCKEFIETMENFGQWSDGSNSDKRLEGGYEAVPTRDIHMTQVGFDEHWLHILQEYVRPLQEMVFIGYFNNPPKSRMNFIVRYRPDEQPFLRPHHDSSTYTINLALNTPQLDYEGGGCRFIRYNCSVTDTKPGWLLMHPGRLTHYHEGLKVLKGTRYIMISFVDP